MGATLRREEQTYRRKGVFVISDRPHETHPDYATIQPGTVTVELSRENDRDHWGIDWLSVHGRRILADESVGNRYAEHYYHYAADNASVHTASDWVQGLANGYLIVSEVERQGRLLRPADVRDNPEYFISGPGLALAEATYCGHGRTLTSGCPGCDWDEKSGMAPYGSCGTWTGNQVCARPVDKFGLCDRPSDHT